MGAFDSIQLKYIKKSKVVTSKLVGYRIVPILPLKWLPQGSLPILFSGLIHTTLTTILRRFTSFTAVLDFMTTHVLSAFFVGITVGLLQSIVYLGASPNDMQKYMNNMGARIPGVR